MEKVYDLIIIGSGPAGLTAAIYAARYKLETLVIGKLLGGIASEASEVFNYPGFGLTTGFELMMKMTNQVKELGVEIKNESVSEILEGFEVVTSKERYKAKKIILATGTERRKLGVDREKELTGRGVSYCATCDAGFYKDKVASVVGGGDAALAAAILIARFAKKVYIIYRKESFFRAEPMWIEEVEKNPKIEPVFNSKVKSLIGETKLEKIELDSGRVIDVDGIFVEIGSDPNIDLAGKLGVEIEDKYIKVDKHQKTNVSGIYAAGDITNNSLKQIITACGEGAIAAHTAYEEIQSSK